MAMPILCEVCIEWARIAKGKTISILISKGLNANTETAPEIAKKI